VILRFALAIAALWLTGTAEAAAAEPTKVLTFIEVRSGAVDRCKTILKHYAAALRQHSNTGVVQEIGRPERFVVIETAAGLEALAAAESGAQSILASLDEFLTAPPDRRTHSDFGGVRFGGAPFGGAPTSPVTDLPAKGLYVIFHLDLGPPDQKRGEAARSQVIDAARHSPGNLRFEAWQQSNRPNHFNIVEVWSDRAKLNDFTAGTAAREFRTTVGPLIGSLFDERLYERID
jgi:quinol monooxygenase YgiN